MRCGACAWAVGCAADPGDAPKSGDGLSASSSDAASASGNAEAEAPDAPGGGGDTSDAGAVEVADSAASDSPGDSGSPDVESSDGAAPDAFASTCTLCPLVVQYATPTAGATADIAVHVQIANNGASDENLDALTLRYWYTADGSPSQAFACDYAVVGCSIVQASFVTMASPVATADHYLELSFTGATVAAGASTGDIQVRFHDTSYAVTFTQTNDYSFNAAYTAYAPWNHITLYRGGTLLFGVEP